MMDIRLTVLGLTLSPGRRDGKFSSPGSTFCADSILIFIPSPCYQGQLSVLTILVFIPSLCYHSSMQNIMVILPKVQVADMHPQCCGFK